jgi:RHH-type proline utilization regulon transcriptional repressor/proline dehydrogenase/delta 1-pyrroline-5-carboxylate dehydrogenase
MMSTHGDHRKGVEGTGLDARVVVTGRELFAAIGREHPSLFDRRRWLGALIDRSLKDPVFRTQVLRFVDVFPTLRTSGLLAGHLRDYFADQPSMPAPLRWAVGNRFAEGPVSASILARAARMAVDRLGRQFIAGDTVEDTMRGLREVRRSGCAFSVDILGEAVVSEDEAEEHARRYAVLVDSLERARASWTSLHGKPALSADGDRRSDGRDDGLDWGHTPKINISLKPSSFYSQARPQDFEGSVAAILKRLCPIYERIMAAGGALTIDMESFVYKDITIAVYKKLRETYPLYRYLSIAMQAYLRDTVVDLSDLIEWSRARNLDVSIRLVKGAYWDYEVTRARQNGWRCPVYTEKTETDAAFERLVRTILENHDTAYLACSSHNVRSIAAALVAAAHLGVPDDRYEFQMLFGMAEPVRKALLARTGRVRLYCPCGPIVPGIAYLVRRLLENTANQGFLRQAFSIEPGDIDSLLRDPAEIDGVGAARPGAAEQASSEAARRASLLSPMAIQRSSSHSSPDLPPFRNEPPFDFTSREERELMREALAAVRGRLGQTLPLFINGSDELTVDRDVSRNPAFPEEIVARVCQAGTAEANAAIAAAGKRFETWRETEASARADYLMRAAAHLRALRHESAAWQVLEIGKQWDQASADVAEAIDFLEYYAREARRIGRPKRLSSPPGEDNYQVYEPRGVALVIAPWNFPLAISTGMVSAAIVAGNCVIYKPSPFTPLIGHLLVDAFRAARLPPGVFNYLPGRTEIIAEYLVDHPAVSTIAFTGSTKVGLGIIERASVLKPGQGQVKRVICEMGGKNGIIVDEDADLDEAVPAILSSAFGFQGQKCSSCSRVIVIDSIYDGFVTRLIEGARSLRVGPPENPAYSVGPASDERARDRILDYVEVGKQEGKLLYRGEVPKDAIYAPVTIIGDIRPEHRIAQEEIFGPVLAVMRARSFDEAIEWANSTRFALTGGVFSRSPRHLEEAKQRFRVGNLYLNRQITGAIVGRQPFGGMGLSGLGTRAGGEEYLLHFMDPRVVTENTARRGFVPEELLGHAGSAGTT